MPDLAFAIHKVRKFMYGPLNSYWFVVKQILCYLKHLVSTGLLITKAMDFILQTYSDSNWADDRDD